jgi:hypothetical protein
MIQSSKHLILLFMGILCIALQCDAAPTIDATYSLHEGYLTVNITNKGNKDILISGFMEGMSEAKLYRKSSPLPLVMNERVTQFDVNNKNILWLRLRALDVKYPGFGSSYRYREKIESDKFLKFLTSVQDEELYIEIVCRCASMQDSNLSKFEIIKLKITKS